MPQKERSPLSRLALPQFHHSFKDLIGIQAYMTPFSRSLLEYTFEMIMWFGRPKDEYDNFERTARAAYRFLENGCQVDHKSVAQRFYKVIDKIIPALNGSRRAQAEASEIPTEDVDSRIEKYLAYYKVMYERLLPFVCAPVITAFGFANNIPDKSFRLINAEKADLNTINKMSAWLTYNENRLAIGLNNHIRNAYSHDNYRILDDARVELWDRLWGPEVWHLEELIKKCDQLWVNGLGIICALILYDINNRKIVEKHGWVSHTNTPNLRRQELYDVIESTADELGFYTRKIESLPKGISINLAVKSKGIDQDSDLYMGYEDHTNLFKIFVRYEEKRVVDQLIIMLNRLIPYFNIPSEVAVHVVSFDDLSLGSLLTDFDTINDLHLQDARSETVNGIRHVLKTDTLGDCMTFVEIKGAPRFVGQGPAKPRNLPYY
jgi:hypothetical protein